MIFPEALTDLQNHLQAMFQTGLEQLQNILIMVKEEIRS